MTAGRIRKKSSVVAQATEMAVAVPQVVAHRVARMALAGPMLSERDRKEFDRMLAEKETAFHESWSAMAAQAWLAQRALTSQMIRSMLTPTLTPHALPAQWVSHWHQETLGVLSKGLGPVHRKAMANAKRLARTRLR